MRRRREDAAIHQLVICAVTRDLLNIAFSAVVMSAGELAVKKKPVDAQFTRSLGIFGMMALTAESSLLAKLVGFWIGWSGIERIEMAMPRCFSGVQSV
jgi:hypothetical protein